MAKMGKVCRNKKLTPEEEIRYKDLLRERDRERKRIKRMNPEYRRLEQERDRDRKKARRANEAFRQLEKLREKIRKERKKGIIVDEAALAQQFNLIAPTPVEPEVIISDPLPPSTSPTTNPHNNNNNNNNNNTNTNNNNNTNNHNHLLDTTTTEHNRRHHRQHLNSTHLSGNNIASVIGLTSGNANNAAVPSITNTMSVNNAPSSLTSNNMPHMPHKSLLYPGPSFPHHPLPIPALLPCHPMLHHNLMYPQNGIKQEYISTNDTNSQNNQQMSGTGGNGGNGGSGGGGGGIHATTNNNDDHDITMIEPEIILQTSPDVIAAPHHFNNHAHAHTHSTHTHHLQQQQCNMFQHMTPSAHIAAHMRAHVNSANSIIPPPPSSITQNSTEAHNPIIQQQQSTQR